MSAQLALPDGSLIQVDTKPITLGRSQMEAACPSYKAAHVSRCVIDMHACVVFAPCNVMQALELIHMPLVCAPH